MGKHGIFPLVLLFVTILGFLFVVLMMQQSAPVLDENETPDLAAAQSTTESILRPVAMGWWGMTIVVVGLAVLGAGGAFLSVFRRGRR